MLLLLLPWLLSAGPAPADQVQFSAGQWTALAAPTPGTPQGELAMIRQALEAGRARRALKLADRFVERHPEDAGVEEAMYLAGAAQMERGRYWQAYERFEKQISRFPAGEFLRRATAREAEIARAFLAGKRRLVWGLLPLPAAEEGISILERVVGRVSGTDLAAQSLLAVAEYYYGHQRWQEAALTYDRYVEMFAGQYETSGPEYLAALALYRSFRGVSFEDTPLLEARQRFGAFAAKHPRHPQAGAAVAAINQIEDLLAEKDYRAGRFYERVGRPEPAGFYYRLVGRLHSDSPWAAPAEEALAELNLPAQAPLIREAPGVESVP